MSAAPSLQGVIDWRLANTVARMVASTTPAPDVPMTGFASEVETFAARSAELVAGYTGLAGAETLPAPETVDRGGWAATNLGSMRSVLDPVSDRVGSELGPLSGPLRALTA